MGVEQIVRGVALPRLRQPHHVDQHIREGVAGHRAISPTLHLEIEKEGAVAGQDGDRPHRAVLLETAQKR